MKSKTIYFVFLLLFISFQTNAQDFVWARGDSGTLVRQVLPLAGGSSLSAGILYQHAILGDSLIDTKSWGDIFITQNNASGEVEKIWHTSGTSTADRAELIAIDIDKHENIYLVGMFSGKIKFGPYTMSFSSNLPGDRRTFITKIDSSGNFVWNKIFDAPQPFSNPYILLSDIASNNNDLIIYGIANEYLLDGDTINNSHGGMFLAKLSGASGTKLWHREIWAPDGSKIPSKIETDDSNNIFVSGTNGKYTETVPHMLFGKDTLYTTGSVNFLAKYDQNGNYKWSTEIGNYSSFGSTDMKCDGNTIFITGGIKNIPGKQYVAAYTTNGTLIWLTGATTQVLEITTSKTGLYFSANFASTFQYDNISLSQPGSYTVIGKIDKTTGMAVWHTAPISKSLHTYFSKDFVSAGSNGGIFYAGSTKNLLKLDQSVIGSSASSFGFTSLLHDTTFSPSSFNTLQGNVFNDTNINCVNDNEEAVGDWGIIAMPGPYYSTTDISGNYTLKVDTGNYDIYALRPAGHHFKDTLICITTGHSVTFTGGNQTKNGYDFPQNIVDCHLLSVSGWQDSINNNRTLITNITISNMSFDTATSVTLTIKYAGSFARPLSSNVSWSGYNPLDSTLTFNAIKIPPASDFKIRIVDTFLRSNDGNPDIVYEAMVSPINNCYPSDSKYNHYTIPYIPGLSVDKLITTASKISVFPNPTTGTLHINGMESALSIEVYNLMGNKIFQQNKGILPEASIDLSNVIPGVYILIIKTENGMVHRKIQKQ